MTMIMVIGFPIDQRSAMVMATSPRILFQSQNDLSYSKPYLPLTCATARRYHTSVLV